MAKLSARGRYELLRMSRERDVPNPCTCQGHPHEHFAGGDVLHGAHTEGCHNCACQHGPSLTTWRRSTLALMSDGKILEKEDVIFRSDGRRYTYNWKVRGKVKPGATLLERCTNLERIWLAKGYTKVGRA